MSGRQPSPAAGERPGRIDAHQHVWDLASGRYDWPTPSDGPIYRTFTPDDLAVELAGSGIDRTVLVQVANSLADTDSMLDIARHHPAVAGVVGWLPLDDFAVAEAALAARAGLLSGVRHLIHREADPRWLLRPQVQPGLALLSERGLPLDVVAVFPDHLGLVPTLADLYPELVMVVDHLAKPPFRAEGWDGWLRDLRAAAAASPRVYAKVSGLDTAAGPGWDVAEIRPAFDAALEAFGPSRLMFGSDWPVCRMVSQYADVVRAAEALIRDLAPDARARIMGGTAAEVYGLDSERHRAAAGAG